MSALGQKQTFPRVRLMSALPPKADIRTGLQPRNSGRRLHGECVLRLPLPTYTRPGPGAGMGGATRKGDRLDSFDSRSYLAVMSLRERIRRRGGIEPCLHSFALLHEKSRLA